MRQQALGTAQAMAPIYSQGYQQAVQTAAGQQGVMAQDLARRMQGGQQLAALGTGAQQAALQGAQAQLAAGTAEQQTQQADLTARYQQFLQERGYPFQVAQFLANIAMGTGALSGSTTTTTQPAGFFSDERLKEDAVRIGETDEGLPIYSYRYKGQGGPKQIGLMAQDVEKVHPEAVGLAAAADGHYYKTVDYAKATERPRKEYGGGLDFAGADENWMGGAVQPQSQGLAFSRGGYAPGGAVDPNDIQALLAAQRQSFGPFGQSGLYGGPGAGAGAPGGGGIVPEAKLPVPRLITAGGTPRAPRSGFEEATQAGKSLVDLYKTGQELRQGYNDISNWLSGASGSKGSGSLSGKAYGGAIGYADGGEIDPYEISNDPLGDVVKAGKSEIRELPKPGQPPGPPKSGLGEVADIAKGASSLFSLGSTAASGLSALAALLPFSDERMKDNVKPVGETYDGQTIYRYNLGDGATQLGLMAQESRSDAVHKDGLGLLHLDYKKATEDAVPFAYGGLVPRQGYQVGGEIDDYSAEADLPAVGATEVSENPRERFIREMTPHAMRVAEETGLDPRLVIAKSALETGYGRSAPGQNYFGIKSHGRAGGQDLATTEVLDGRPTRVRDSFRSYADMGESASDYANFLRTNPRYRSLLAAPDLGSQIEALGRSGYATDPNYASKIRNIASGLGPLREGDLPAPSSRETGGEGKVPLGEAVSRGRPGEYAGVPASKASFGDFAREYLPSGFPTSEKFWVPTLGFLSSMLSSKSPFLGQAIGEGLAGGLSAYTGLEKGRADIGKTESETRALEQRTDLELVDRLLKFNQVRIARGQPPITSLEEFKKKLADGSIIEPSAPAQGAPAAPSTQAGAAPAAGAVSGAPSAPSTPSAAVTSPDVTERALAAPNVQRGMSQINWGNVADSHNIPKIQEELRITSQLAQTATEPDKLQQFQERQAALRNEINKIIESRQLVLKDGSVVVPPEWQRVANQIEGQKTTAAKDAERFSVVQDNMEQMQSAAPEILQRWNKMGEILEQYRTDKAANFKTYATALADAVGIKVDPEKLRDVTDFERFVKLARDQLFGRLQEVGGRILVSEIQRMQESVTDPTLQPASNRALIAQGKALTEYHQAFYDAFRDWKSANPYATADEFASFRREWQKNNSLRSYSDRAEANTPVRGDLPEADRRKDGWLYVNDTPEARNLTRDGQRVTPNGFIGRWNKERGVFTDLRPL
jgi:hypothetical protein